MKRILLLISSLLFICPLYAKKPPFIPSNTVFGHMKGDAGEYLVDHGLLDRMEFSGWKNTMPRPINQVTLEPIRQGLDHLELSFKNGNLRDILVVETKFKNCAPENTLNLAVGQGSDKWFNSRIRGQAAENYRVVSERVLRGDCITEKVPYPDYKTDWKLYIDNDSYFYKKSDSNLLFFYDRTGSYDSSSKIANQCNRTADSLSRFSEGSVSYRKRLVHYFAEDGKVYENVYSLSDNPQTGSPEIRHMRSRDISGTKALDNILDSDSFRRSVMDEYSITDADAVRSLTKDAKLDLLSRNPKPQTIKEIIRSSTDTPVMNAKLKCEPNVKLSQINFSNDELSEIGLILRGKKKAFSGTLSKTLHNADVSTRLGLNSGLDLSAIGLSEKEYKALMALNADNFDDIVSPSMAKKLLTANDNMSKFGASADYKPRLKVGNNKYVDVSNLSDNDCKFALKKMVAGSQDDIMRSYTIHSLKHVAGMGGLYAGGMFAADVIYQGFHEGWDEIDWGHAARASFTFGAVIGVNALGDIAGDMLQKGLLKSSVGLTRSLGKFAPFGVGLLVDTAIDAFFLYSSAYRGDLSYKQATVSLMVNIPINAAIWGASLGIGSMIGGPIGFAVGGAVGAVLSIGSTFVVTPIQNHIKVNDLYKQISGPYSQATLIRWTDSYIAEMNN